jgi:hypothetical protein
MIRYRHDAYDHALAQLTAEVRKSTEGTFTGLRFVRNCMGFYVDPADFIQPRRDSLGGDAPVPAWTWRQVPASVSATALIDRSFPAELLDSANKHRRPLF